MLLAEGAWRPLEAAHHARVDAAAAAHVGRRRAGMKHPVEDFLWTYYSHRPAQLRRWHPGPGVELAGDTERADSRHYVATGRGTTLDVDAYLADRGDTVRFVRDLLASTLGRPAQLSCFGLHEWAMVYHLEPDQVRHHVIPLRLTPAEIDAVVDAHEIRCSHYDAFRFFTPDARGLNALRPDAERQPEFEQPGCLHGGAMDLYRWAFKLHPGVPGDLVLDCFDLARRARLLDMRSSPYDVRSFGLPNIAIETPDGKTEHVREQRAIAEAAALLRPRLIGVLRRLSPQGAT